MSNEKKERLLWLARSISMFGILSTTGMMAFLLWANDARIREIGDVRYVAKDQYREDKTKIETRIDYNEKNIVTLRIKTGGKQGNE